MPSPLNTDTVKPRCYSAEDEAFFRQFVMPEEDRHLFTSAPWDGSFRWFQSSNVVCLEKWPRPIKPNDQPTIKRA